MQTGWIKQEDDTFLPEWLVSNLPGVCSCGSPMENFYNQQGRITGRRCSDEKCPFKVARKIVGMCDILKVKGIGEAKALSLVKSYKLTSQFEALPKILPDSKPKVSLYNFLRMCFIKGMDTTWGQVVGENETIEELYNNYKGEYRVLLDKYKSDILYNANFVEFERQWKPTRDALITGTVMISGNIKGYANRNNFIAALNVASQGLIRISVAENKRKTGILALIQEADTPNRGKAECAMQNHIPILTPEEFKLWCTAELKERLTERKRT